MLSFIKKIHFLFHFIFSLSLNTGFAQWQQANIGNYGGTVSVLAIDTTTHYLYADTRFAGEGVFLSSNNGDSWTAVNNGLSGVGLLVLSIARS